MSGSAPRGVGRVVAAAGGAQELDVEQAWTRYAALETRDGALDAGASQLSRGTFLPSVSTPGGAGVGAQRSAFMDAPGSPGAAAAADGGMVGVHAGGALGGMREAPPQLDLPQRLPHPCGLNAPPRTGPASRDERILLMFGAQSAGGQDASEWRKRGSASCKARTHNNNSALVKLLDLDMIIKTCRRAGKAAQEAQALYSKGVLLDNIERWGKAVESYEAYLRLCLTLNDDEGACVAYNCTAVAYFNLALGGPEAADRALGLHQGHAKEADEELAPPGHGAGAGGLDAAATAHLNTSILYSIKQHDASDEAGQFVALTNIGLCHARLGDFARAVDYHQQALRLGITTSNPQAQCLAVGNLALASAQLGDWKIARSCMDKHLHLVRDLHNVELESLACQQLGQIANRHGQYADAAQYFAEARKIAVATGERGMVKLINVSVGVTTGNLRMKDYMQQLAQESHHDARLAA
jgi:tetratricopeptide (TPR) repeat protein